VGCCRFSFRSPASNTDWLVVTRGTRPRAGSTKGTSGFEFLPHFAHAADSAPATRNSLSAQQPGERERKGERERERKIWPRRDYFLCFFSFREISREIIILRTAARQLTTRSRGRTRCKIIPNGERSISPASILICSYSRRRPGRLLLLFFLFHSRHSTSRYARWWLRLSHVNRASICMRRWRLFTLLSRLWNLIVNLLEFYATARRHGGKKFLILQPEFNRDIYARCTPRKSYAGINNAHKGGTQLLPGF